MLTCEISGEVPDEPVVSKLSGHIFEKRLILKAITDSGICPVTKQEITPLDLVDIKTLSKTTAPRPPSATSISSMLKIFQEEWDALLLECYKLKQHVTQVRQELSHALYQHDAACRVIARVTQERDKARLELSETRKNMAAALAHTASGSAMDVEAPTGFTDELVSKILEKSEELQKWRRGRPKKPEGLATKQQIGQLKEISSNHLHSPSDSGILSLALHSSKPELVFTGGVDSNILCWNTKTQRIEQTLKGHKKKVTVLETHPDGKQQLLISGSSDKTVKLWSYSNEEDKWSIANSLSIHTASVNDIDIHPLGDHFVSCSDDQSWAFSSITTGSVIQKISTMVKYDCCEFHPDGRLMGTGDSNHAIQIWELHNQNSIVTLTESKTPVTSISFSENGYHMAAASVDGVVRVYDLRKTNLLHEFSSNGSRVNKVEYDKSGQYLAIASQDIRVYQSRTWTALTGLTSHTRDVTALRWGANAKSLYSVSKDRSLKVYAL